MMAFYGRIRHRQRLITADVAIFAINMIMMTASHKSHTWRHLPYEGHTSLFIAVRAIDDLKLIVFRLQISADNSTNITFQLPNITKPFCQNVNLSDAEMLAYRYTLVLVQYIIPVCVISFVYIQV